MVSPASVIPDCDLTSERRGSSRVPVSRNPNPFTQSPTENRLIIESDLVLYTRTYSRAGHVYELRVRVGVMTASPGHVTTTT